MEYCRIILRSSYINSENYRYVKSEYKKKFDKDFSLTDNRNDESMIQLLKELNLSMCECPFLVVYFDKKYDGCFDIQYDETQGKEYVNINLSTYCLKLIEQLSKFTKEKVMEIIKMKLKNLNVKFYIYFLNNVFCDFSSIILNLLFKYDRLLYNILDLSSIKSPIFSGDIYFIFNSSQELNIK